MYYSALWKSCIKTVKWNLWSKYISQTLSVFGISLITHMNMVIFCLNSFKLEKRVRTIMSLWEPRLISSLSTPLFHQVFYSNTGLLGLRGRTRTLSAYVHSTCKFGEGSFKTSNLLERGRSSKFTSPVYSSYLLETPVHSVLWFIL